MCGVLKTTLIVLRHGDVYKRQASAYTNPGLKRTRLDKTPYYDYTVDMSGSRTAPPVGEGGGKGPKTETGTGGVDVNMKEGASSTGIDNIASGSVRPATTAPTVKPISNWQKGGQTFTHKRIMSTFIHNFKYINANVPYKVDNAQLAGNQYYLVTPYAYVPADIIGFYFTENEIAELPLTSECTHFKTMIRPIGFRLPFQTQASGTTFANSMTDIVGMYAYGLNNTFNGRNMLVNYSSTDPCTVENVEAHAPLDQPYFPKTWTATEVATPSTKPISCSVGNILPFLDYFVATGVMEEGTAGEPLLMDAITTFDMMNKGNIAITYEYRPEICILKEASSSMPFWQVKKNPNDPTKFIHPQIILGKKVPFTTFLNAKFGYESSRKSTNVLFSDFKLHPSYVQPGTDANLFNMRIEMAGLVSRGIGELSSCFLPPTLHIGGLPVDSHVAPGGNSCQPCIIMWEVITEASVAWNYSYTHATNRHVKRECVTYFPYADQYLGDADQEFAYGYRSTRNPIT